VTVELDIVELVRELKHSPTPQRIVDAELALKWARTMDLFTADEERSIALAVLVGTPLERAIKLVRRQRARHALPGVKRRLLPPKTS
jgi:hypothetical protein